LRGAGAVLLCHGPRNVGGSRDPDRGTTKFSTTQDSYETWREGDHDDLVLFVALVCWAGERYIRKLESMPKPGLIASEVPANVIGCPACNELGGFRILSPPE
jgi:hypothetical protein